jgi:hypothetical protein
MRTAALRVALRPLLAAIVVLLAAAPVDAQSTSDEQLWLSAGARIELSDRVDVSLDQMLRLDQGFNRVGKAMPELGVSLDLPAGFRVHGGYRFTADRRSEGTWRYENRLFVGARYRYDVGPFELGYRIEFQEDRYRKRETALHDNVIRNRFSLALEAHDVVRPFVSYEALANLGGSPGTGLRSWRVTVGTELALGDHDIDVFYRVRRPFNAPIDTDHIIGLGYRISF